MKHFVQEDVVVQPLSASQTKNFNTITAGVRPVQVVVNPVVGKAVWNEHVKLDHRLAQQ